MIGGRRARGSLPTRPGSILLLLQVQAWQSNQRKNDGGFRWRACGQIRQCGYNGAKIGYMELILSECDDWPYFNKEICSGGNKRKTRLAVHLGHVRVCVCRCVCV